MFSFLGNVFSYIGFCLVRVRVVIFSHARAVTVVFVFDSASGSERSLKGGSYQLCWLRGFGGR